MRRLIAIAAATAAIACSALLGLEDHTLRDAGVPIDASADAIDASTSCTNSGWCACHPHDFCDDFDSYKSAQELKTKWKNSGYPGTIELGGSLTLDSLTTTPPSPPNALLARTGVPSFLGGTKLALAGATTLLDGKPLHTAPIIGIALEFSIRVDYIYPDGSAPIRDSGAYLIDGIMAVVNPKTNNGAGIAFSEEDGYIGYVLDVLSSKGSLAQGSGFLHYKPAVTIPIFQHIRVVIAQRKSKQLGDVKCKQGPVLTLNDASAPDGGDLGLETVVIAVFPLTSSVATAECEILSGDLANADWLSAPYAILGSAQTGNGTVQLAFDNVSADFLTE